MAAAEKLGGGEFGYGLFLHEISDDELRFRVGMIT